MLSSSKADSLSNITTVVTVIIISSYSPFHPSTYLIDSVCKSLNYIPGLDSCHKVVVLDGYETVSATEKPEIKKGKLKQHMVDSYELYCKRLESQYVNSNCSVIRNSVHQGFAFSVKIGLQATHTPYAMILQQDRVFCNPLPANILPQCIDLMNNSSNHQHIRYIGFPTSSSRTHIAQIECRYQGIGCLNDWKHRIRLKEDNNNSNDDGSFNNIDKTNHNGMNNNGSNSNTFPAVATTENNNDGDDYFTPSTAWNLDSSISTGTTTTPPGASAVTIDNHNNQNIIDNNYYGLFLQPCIFWFDSNHFCHVQRYLTIYTPYLSIPSELEHHLGLSRVRELLLRRGDFIEDRFGQMQRKILTQIIPVEVMKKNKDNNNNDDGSCCDDNNHINATVSNSDKTIDDKTDSQSDGDSLLISAFQWFGSYLLWQTDLKYIGYNNSDNHESNISNDNIITSSSVGGNHGDDHDDEDSDDSPTTNIINKNSNTATTTKTNNNTSNNSWVRFPPLVGATATATGELAHSCNIARVFVRHLNGRRKLFVFGSATAAVVTSTTTTTDADTTTNDVDSGTGAGIGIDSNHGYINPTTDLLTTTILQVKYEDNKRRHNRGTNNRGNNNNNGDSSNDTACNIYADDDCESLHESMTLDILFS